MSASLVGSEMCIRDSGQDMWMVTQCMPKCPLRMHLRARSCALHGSWPVSYTHLTLPTICSV
eukprot:441064-Alexandrium_andersonii.AAC.1